MNAVILSNEQFAKLEKAIEEIRTRLLAMIPRQEIIDNQEFIQLLKISKTTAQVWRDCGRIGYSQVGGKVYYKISDVEALFNANYVKPIKK
jgi:hypothetical protein